jgi:hypothetical protein
MTLTDAAVTWPDVAIVAIVLAFTVAMCWVINK